MSSPSDDETRADRRQQVAILYARLGAPSFRYGVCDNSDTLSKTSASL
jgi:hypothetical protein